MKTKLITTLTIAMLLLTTLSTATLVFAYDENAPYTVDLIAGKHIDAGDVQIWNDQNNLYIKIIPDGWTILETHVAVGDELSDIPQTKKGNPIPGKFPLSGQIEYSIPLDDLTGDIFIAIHTVVKGTGCYCNQEETAWAGGCDFDGKNWATYIKYTIQDVLIQTLSIPANTLTPTLSMVLEDGVQYKIVASGTANAGDTIDFDAKYSITNRISGDTWTDLVSGYQYLGTELLDLHVNGVPGTWGEYNDAHQYSMIITGTDAQVSFYIYDTYPINNVGSLTVQIYWMG